MTHLLDLPDDALLAVLGFLPPRQLFACRVACRRLRDLCLHRHLWRHVSLDEENEGVVRAALALAPCLKSIVCPGPSYVDASLLKATSCVITALTLSISGQEGMAVAMAVIRRVYALGGLRELDLYLVARTGDDASVAALSVAALLEVVFYLRGLKKLSLDTEYARHPMLLPVGWCELKTKPSLRELVYASRSSDPFLDLLLRTHAPTLQVLALRTWNDVPLSTIHPRFPALKVLKVDSQPSESFLRDLGPSSAPSLTTLVVCHFFTCLHAWLHSRAVQDVLLRNPRLHLLVDKLSSAEGCSCSWCLRKCHVIPREQQSFSSHSPTGCPEHCLKVTA